MQDFDLHMHTTYCDGNNSAEEMVLAAARKGLKTVGVSGHSFTWFDTSYCMSRENTEVYIAEVTRLKTVYADQIRVLLGTELDYFSEIDTAPYDYLIGSSHYVLKDGCYLDIDYYAELLMEEVNAHFGGDTAAMAEVYYEQVGDIVKKTGCDIVGHFDLITKFNEHFALDSDNLPVELAVHFPGEDLSGEELRDRGLRKLVDTDDPRYIAAWKHAVDRIFEDTAELRKSGQANRLETLGVLTAGDKPVFEINTGAIGKGTRTTAYPAAEQREYIRSKGGILILSSDSHSVDTICFGFDAPEEI